MKSLQMQGRAVNQRCQHNCVAHPVWGLLYKCSIMLLHPIILWRRYNDDDNMLALQCLIPIKPIIVTRMLLGVIFIKNYCTKSKCGSVRNCYTSTVALKIHVKVK